MMKHNKFSFNSAFLFCVQYLFGIIFAIQILEMLNIAIGIYNVNIKPNDIHLNDCVYLYLNIDNTHFSIYISNLYLYIVKMYQMRYLFSSLVANSKQEAALNYSLYHQ